VSASRLRWPGAASLGREWWRGISKSVATSHAEPDRRPLWFVPFDCNLRPFQFYMSPF
jgi:hypothetical protein